MDSPIIKEKMQSKRFFLFIVPFFSFISSLQPWFFWHIKAGIFYAIVFLSFYYYKSNAVFCVKRKYLILIVLLLIAAISHTNSSFFSIISHIFLILSAISIFSCTDLERASFFDILYKCFAILLTISLGFHILLLLGIKLPSLGIIQYGNMDIYLYNNYIFTLYGSYGVRFHSIFCEPGHVGMIISFLLYFLKYDMRNKYVVLLIINLLFTLSLAGYLLLLFGWLINYITDFSAKKMLLIIIVGFSLYYSYVLLVDILSSDNIIYEYVLKRLVYDEDAGTIKGDNRVSQYLTDYIENNLSLYEYLLGLSHDKFDKLIAMYGGGSGYKMYLIEFGMLSIVFVFFFYFYMLYLFKENRHFMIGAFLLFVIAFIQRSYPFWISEMFIFMLGPSYILVNNQSKIDGKS